MKITAQKNYAKLLVRMGLSVRKGDEVRILADLDQPEFVKFVVEECYRAGAKRVRVEWSYQPVTKVNSKRASLKALSKLEDWEIEKARHHSEALPALLYLESADPDGMKGADQNKLTKVRQAQYPVFKPFEDAMENRFKWCIAGVPGEAWAKKVFPGVRASKAVELLWEAILKTSRADGDDPVAAWKEHNARLAKRCDYLNSLDIESLRYTASNGTDLTVGLIEGSIFTGGSEPTLGGEVFNPNIPSEEVFTSPMRGAAEGVVYATKPLSYRGELIEDFSVRFEGGRAVEARAAKNEELLRTMIGMDEGAAYLGECSFVPWDSPINNSGVLFYNTLYDENACCHLALGAGFSGCLKDYEKLSLDECRERGINDSMIHVDFMVGSPDLTVTARCRGGKEVAVFSAGNWAFEI